MDLSNMSTGWEEVQYFMNERRLKSDGISSCLCCFPLFKGVFFLGVWSANGLFNVNECLFEVKIKLLDLNK